MASIQDLPIEIVKKIFKNLDPISVKNCSITCMGWKEIVAHYIFQPYLQELAIDENLSLSLKQKIRKKGWTHDCVDYNLIIALYEEFKFFKARILVTSGLYDQSNKRQLNKVTEIIDLFDHESSFGFIDPAHMMRVASSGGQLEGNLIICGGAKYTKSCEMLGGKHLGLFQDMYSMDDEKVNSEYLIEQRAFSASVILNINKFTTNLWVTGGKDRRDNGLKSSEFILIRDALELDDENQPSEVKQLDSIQGPELPFTISQHGMAKISENAIYIIGGRQDDEISQNVWIIDPKDQYSVKKGPSLKTSRYDFSCGTMEVDGKTIIVVAGGYTKPKTFLDTVELLDPLSKKGWIPGPKLPYKMVGASMVTSPGTVYKLGQ